MRILTLVVYRKYFDQIGSGEKKTEYRDMKSYWVARLEGKNFDAIFFVNGYGRGCPNMLVECLGIDRNYGTKKYEIKLGKVLERNKVAV